MPLSSPVSRQLRHTRKIRLEAFERDDGLWDIDACLTDEKPRDVHLASGVRPTGLPIHELWLRITIDRKLTIVDAQASSQWAPYGSLCAESNSAYRQLIGLNLLKSFRREVNQRLRGVVGCTHLTELCAVLPTVAIQAFAGDVWSIEEGDDPFEQGNQAESGAKEAQPPFQLGRCHALRFDGPAVREFYPRWVDHRRRTDDSTNPKPESTK